MAREIKKKLQEALESNSMRIEELKRADHPKFAVFLRTPSGNRAKFRNLHSSLEDAIEVARNHAVECVVAGIPDFTYYVVEIKYRVGIEDASPVDKFMV